MPITLTQTLANLPDIERGYGYVMNADSKKGARLLYCNKKSVFLRSLEDPSQCTIFAGEHKANVVVAQSSPNGEWIASGDCEGNLCVWGQKNQMVKNMYPINQCIADVAWDGEGKRIVAVGQGKESSAKVITWDTGSGIGSVSGHNKKILACDYKKTRPFRVVTAGEDMISCFHEGPPFKYKHSMKDHSNFINKARFSPDGEKLVTVGSDRKIFAYDGKTGEKIKEIESKEDGHKGSIMSLAWSADSKSFLTASADKTAKLWDYESGTVTKTFTFAEKPEIKDMQMSCVWEGDYMVTASLSGAINYLDMENPSKPKQIVLGHAGVMTDVAVDRTTKSFYTSDVSGVVCAWTNGVASWFTGKGHGKAIRAIALNHDGSKLITAGLDDSMRINECKTMEFSDEAIKIGGVPKSLCCGSKTDTIVVGNSKGDVIVFKGATQECKVNLKHNALSLSLSPDETKLAVGMEKEGVQVYDYTGGALKLAYELKDLSRKVLKVEWSPCGKFLVCSGADRQVLVYEGEKQLNRTGWECHRGGVIDHAWSPSGKRVASVASDLQMLVFSDTEEWSPKRQAIDLVHQDGVLKVQWLDEDTLVTLGSDACIKLWNVTEAE